MPALTIEYTTGTRSYELPEGIHVFIGRDPVCEISLPSPKVSRMHAVIIYKSGICGIKDLGSNNGTWLNDRRIAKPTVLREKDRITIGTHSFLFSSSAKAVVLTETASVPRPRPDTRKHTSVREAAASDSMRKLMDEVETPQDKSTLHGSDTQDFGEPVPAAVTAAETPSAGRRIMAAKHAMPHGDPVPPEPPVEFYPTVDMQSASVEPVEDDAGDDFEPIALDDTPAADRPDDSADAQSDEEQEQEAPDTAEAAHPDMDAIPISDDMRKAVDERLKLYPKLGGLAAERKKYRTQTPGLPKNVVAELERQDLELSYLPTLDQAEKLLAARRSSWQSHFDKNGNPSESALDVEAGLSLEMFAAEKMALDQWELIIESGRKHLPEIYRLGYRVMAPEPLARCLDEARIDHSALLGGAAYCLTLEALQSEAEAELENVRERMEKIREGTESGKADAPIVGRMVHTVSRLFNLHKVDKKKLAAYAAKERSLLTRSKSPARERTMLEKTMTMEFWKVYADAACHYFASDSELPPPVRAFLRFGAIGSKPWWMTDAVREYIEANCRDVTRSLATGNDATNVVYADEYLLAVMRMECSPGPRGQDGPAADEKTDRLVRRLVNSRARVRLIKEILDGIKAGIDAIDAELMKLDVEIMDLSSAGPKAAKRLGELHSERGALAESKKELTERRKKVKRFGEDSREVYADTDRLFRESRVAMPPPDAVVRRECGIVSEIARHLSGQRERFLPLLIRDGAVFSPDNLNEREDVKASLREIEALDPGLFRINVISAKKPSNRVDLRAFPVTVVIPANGARAYSCHPREGMESGRLAVPAFYSRPRVQRQRLVELLADYRWDSSTMVSGRDIMNSDTLAGAFSRLRWNWRE